MIYEEEGGLLRLYRPRPNKVNTVTKPRSFLTIASRCTNAKRRQIKSAFETKKSGRIY